MSVTLLQPHEVRAILKGPDRSRVMVVDVRDDDYVGGHIAGCINFPRDNFDEKAEVDAFILQQIVPRAPETVIVHCFLSQQRGPFCAKRLASRLQALEMKGPRVCVLAFGFKRFNQLYGSDPELIVEDEQENGEANEAQPTTTASVLATLEPCSVAARLPEACCQQHVCAPSSWRN